MLLRNFCNAEAGGGLYAKMCLLQQQSGNTMVTITHDVRCAEVLCDEAYLIEGGVVAKRGGKELVRQYFAQS